MNSGKMGYRSIIAATGLLLLPGVAQAEGPFISLEAGLIVLGLQLLPFIHILWSKQLATCYKTGYCMLFLSILAIAWLAVAILAAFFPNAPDLLIRLPLLLPILFWIYTFTLGKDVRESERRTCQLPDRTTDSDQPEI